MVWALHDGDAVGNERVAQDVPGPRDAEGLREGGDFPVLAAGRNDSAAATERLNGRNGRDGRIGRMGRMGRIGRDGRDGEGWTDRTDRTGWGGMDGMDEMDGLGAGLVVVGFVVGWGWQSGGVSLLNHRL